MLGELVTTTGDLKTQLDTLAVEIKAEIKRTIESAIRIGKMLLQAKDIAADPKCGIEGANPNIRFGKWVAGNFPETLKADTAQNFMNVARVYGDRDPTELDKIGLSVLYELSAPKVTKNAVTVREAVEDAIKRGEKVTVQDVREWIKEATLALPKPTLPAPLPEPVEVAEIEEVDDTPPWEEVEASTDLPEAGEPDDQDEPVRSPSIFDNKMDEDTKLRLQIGELMGITCENLGDLFVQDFKKYSKPDYLVGVARTKLIEELREGRSTEDALTAARRSIRDEEDRIRNEVEEALLNMGQEAMKSFIRQTESNKLLNEPSCGKLLQRALDNRGSNIAERRKAYNALLARR